MKDRERKEINSFAVRNDIAKGVIFSFFYDPSQGVPIGEYFVFPTKKEVYITDRKIAVNDEQEISFFLF